MKLRFLHLSDLHFSYNNKCQPHLHTFNQNIVIEPMLDTIKDLVQQQSTTFDFIVITGDLTWQGKYEEYKIVKEFIEKLEIITGLTRQNIYIVPGNHDIDRSKLSNLRIHKLLYDFKNQNEITEIILDPVFSPIIMDKFSDFNIFTHSNGFNYFNQSNYSYAQQYLLKENNVKINIVGLNSVIFAGYDGDDNRKIALGLPQVKNAIDKLYGNALLSIVFFHHPFECFHPAEDEIKNRLMSEFDIILTGHLHKPSNSFIQNLFGKTIMISAGTCYGDNQIITKKSFNIIEIDLISGKGHVIFYKYLDDHGIWTIDHDINPNKKDGKFDFYIDSIKKHSKTPQTKTNGKLSSHFIKNLSNLNQKFERLHWIAYSPTDEDPDSFEYPNEKSLKDDINVIYKSLFDAIITFDSINNKKLIPRIAKEIGIKGIIMGIYDCKDRNEIEAAIENKNYVDGYCIGLGSRIGSYGYILDYKDKELKEAINEIRRKTERPVSTTQYFADCLINSEITKTIDWIFPDVHYYWHEGAQPDAAANDIIKKIMKIKNIFNFSSERKIVLKMICYPSGGGLGLTEDNQSIFFDLIFQRLKNNVSIPKNICYTYYAAFDNKWKTHNKGWSHAELYTGLYNIYRQPKKTIAIFNKYWRSYK